METFVYITDNILQTKQKKSINIQTAIIKHDCVVEREVVAFGNANIMMRQCCLAYNIPSNWSIGTNHLYWEF